MLSTRIYCGECQSPLIGVSAHGKTTKVPYYGHGTQMKREQMLPVQEKGPRCTPFRTPGKKIEERVWKEVLALMERPTHRAPLFQALQNFAHGSPAKKESARKQEEHEALTAKLANLAKRVAELPTEVPAAPFYDEMKFLGMRQEQLWKEIQDGHESGLGQEERSIATEAQYTRQLVNLRGQLTDVSPESKRRIIQALVHQVRVTKDGFELHYYAGVDQIKKGEAPASPLISLGKKISVPSSFKHLNGGPGETRTLTPLRAVDFESTASTIPPQGHWESGLEITYSRASVHPSQCKSSN